MKAFAVLAAFSVAACTAPAPLPASPAAIRFTDVPPYEATAVDCTTPPATPTLCDLVTAHDVVATARILSAEVSWDPAAVSIGGVEESVDPDTCLSLDPAVRLLVAIVDVHAGVIDAADDGDEVEVFIGAKHVSTWTQQLTTLFPSPALRFNDGADRFVVGEHIVLAAFDVGSGVSVWTVLPSVDAADVLTFPPSPCNQPGFIGTGMTTEAFFSAAAACPAATAASTALRASWDLSDAPRQGRLTSWRDAKCYLAGGA